MAGLNARLDDVRSLLRDAVEWAAQMRAHLHGEHARVDDDDTCAEGKLVSNTSGCFPAIQAANLVAMRTC